MFDQFKETLQKYNLLDRNKKVLLAVSGGVDSMLLFHLFTQLSKKECPQVYIAHINHQLRPEADAEEAFVRKLATENNYPFYVYTWDEKIHPQSGIEVEARKIRYQFFQKIMEQENISVLMTGHHQDDQVETILMRLARGSSLKQLRGIQEFQWFTQQKQLIRPLLSFSKDAIYSYADKKEIPFMEDESNQELVYTRNRFRQKIVPLLKAENTRFNEHIEQFILDLTDLLEIAEEPIQTAVEESVLKRKDTVELDLKVFSTYKPPMQRAVLTSILKTIYKNQEESYKTNYIEMIRLWLVEGEVNTQLDLQEGYKVEKNYEDARFFKAKRHPVIVEDEEHLLEKVGEWKSLSETERMGVFLVPMDEVDVQDDEQLLIGKEELALPLRVRHRQPGDRMSYEGLAGSKKIKDIFIDEKVPLGLRDQAWIVEDLNGEIVWLVSYRKLGLFTASETDKLVYVLKYVKD